MNRILLEITACDENYDREIDVDEAITDLAESEANHGLTLGRLLTEFGKENQFCEDRMEVTLKCDDQVFENEDAEDGVGALVEPKTYTFYLRRYQ